MTAPVWTQIDAGVALTIGAIVVTAAVRKLQQPRVFALTLLRLDRGLNPRGALRATFVVVAYELVSGIGVVALRGALGFGAACALLIACVGFLLALARAVQQSVPCSCFGRLGRTAAGGREIGRGIVLVGSAGFLVVHRALDPSTAYGVGPIALVAVVATAVLIAVAQWIGGRVRPGVEVGVTAEPAPASVPVREYGPLLRALRDVVGIDNDLYTPNS